MVSTIPDIYIAPLQETYSVQLRPKSSCCLKKLAEKHIVSGQQVQRKREAEVRIYF